MKHEIFITRTVLVASLMVLPLISPAVSLPAEQKQGTRALQSQGLKQNAVESVQDTLKACLSRIPSNASVGQRLLAEQNCQQVEGNREETQLTF